MKSVNLKKMNFCFFNMILIVILFQINSISYAKNIKNKLTTDDISFHVTRLGYLPSKTKTGKKRVGVYKVQLPERTSIIRFNSNNLDGPAPYYDNIVIVSAHKDSNGTVHYISKKVGYLYNNTGYESVTSPNHPDHIEMNEYAIKALPMEFTFLDADTPVKLIDFGVPALLATHIPLNKAFSLEVGQSYLDPVSKNTLAIKSGGLLVISNPETNVKNYFKSRNSNTKNHLLNDKNVFRLQSIGNGNLSLINQKGKVIWSFNDNKEKKFPNSELVIQPNGGMVIYNTNQRIPSRKVIASYQLKPSSSENDISDSKFRKNLTSINEVPDDQTNYYSHTIDEMPETDINWIQEMKKHCDGVSIEINSKNATVGGPINIYNNGTNPGRIHVRVFCGSKELTDENNEDYKRLLSHLVFTVNGNNVGDTSLKAEDLITNIHNSNMEEDSINDPYSIVSSTVATDNDEQRPIYGEDNYRDLKNNKNAYFVLYSTETNIDDEDNHMLNAYAIDDCSLIDSNQDGQEQCNSQNPGDDLIFTTNGSVPVKTKRIDSAGKLGYIGWSATTGINSTISISSDFSPEKFISHDDYSMKNPDSYKYPDYYIWPGKRWDNNKGGAYLYLTRQLGPCALLSKKTGYYCKDNDHEQFMFKNGWIKNVSNMYKTQSETSQTEPSEDLTISKYIIDDHQALTSLHRNLDDDTSKSTAHFDESNKMLIFDRWGYPYVLNETTTIKRNETIGHDVRLHCMFTDVDTIVPHFWVINNVGLPLILHSTPGKNDMINQLANKCLGENDNCTDTSGAKDSPNNDFILSYKSSDLSNGLRGFAFRIGKHVKSASTSVNVTAETNLNGVVLEPDDWMSIPTNAQMKRANKPDDSYAYCNYGDNCTVTWTDTTKDTPYLNASNYITSSIKHYKHESTIYSAAYTFKAPYKSMTVTFINHSTDSSLELEIEPKSSVDWLHDSYVNDPDMFKVNADGQHIAHYLNSVRRQYEVAEANIYDHGEFVGEITPAKKDGDDGHDWDVVSHYVNDKYTLTPHLDNKTETTMQISYTVTKK